MRPKGPLVLPIALKKFLAWLYPSFFHSLQSACSHQDHLLWPARLRNLFLTILSKFLRDPKKAYHWPLMAGESCPRTRLFLCSDQISSDQSFAQASSWLPSLSSCHSHVESHQSPCQAEAPSSEAAVVGQASSDQSPLWPSQLSAGKSCCQVSVQWWLDQSPAASSHQVSAAPSQACSPLLCWDPWWLDRSPCQAPEPPSQLCEAASVCCQAGWTQLGTDPCKKALGTPERQDPVRKKLSSSVCPPSPSVWGTRSHSHQSAAAALVLEDARFPSHRHSVHGTKLFPRHCCRALPSPATRCLEQDLKQDPRCLEQDLKQDPQGAFVGIYGRKNATCNLSIPKFNDWNPHFLSKTNSETKHSTALTFQYSNAVHFSACFLWWL